MRTKNNLKRRYLKKYTTLLTNKKYIDNILKLLKCKDEELLLHSLRVAKYSFFIIKEIGLAEKYYKKLLFSSLVHDIGKINIPDNILHKPNPLNDVELDLMKQHPVYSEQLLNITDNDIKNIVRHHHEKYNGSGYPDGLIGEEILLLARIITVADSVDAMRTLRPYNKTKTISEIINELELFSNIQFDSNCAIAMIKVLNNEKKDKGKTGRCCRNSTHYRTCREVFLWIYHHKKKI